jgi:hypothetical protein
LKPYSLRVDLTFHPVCHCLDKIPKEGFKEFLSTPLPIFGGRSALVLLELGEYELVISALAADFEGTGF